MSEMAGRMQTQFKKTSGDLLLFGIKFISGVILGLTFALIMQEVMGKAEDENLLAFFFVIVTTMAVYIRLTRYWGQAAKLIFDRVCVLTGLVLRLYIMVAPGA
jgi:hypothetical protein